MEGGSSASAALPPPSGGQTPSVPEPAEPPAKRARPSEAVVRMPETFKWGPFSFTRRRGTDSVRPGWQVQCPHPPEPSRLGEGTLRCTREMRNRGGGEAEDLLTIRRLKHWAVALPLQGVTRTEHMQWQARVVLSPDELPSEADLERTVRTWASH